MNDKPEPSQPRFSMSCTLRVHEKCVVRWCDCPLPQLPAHDPRKESIMSLYTRTYAARIDTAYWASVEPFDGQEDDFLTDSAATKIQAYPAGDAYEGDVVIDIDRTNIRLDLSAQEARALAAHLMEAVEAAS
jgi:hypothetical protein